MRLSLSWSLVTCLRPSQMLVSLCSLNIVVTSLNLLSTLHSKYTFPICFPVEDELHEVVSQYWHKKVYGMCEWMVGRIYFIPCNDFQQSQEWIIMGKWLSKEIIYRLKTTPPLSMLECAEEVNVPSSIPSIHAFVTFHKVIWMPVVEN